MRDGGCKTRALPSFGLRHPRKGTGRHGDYPYIPSLPPCLLAFLESLPPFLDMLDDLPEFK